MPQQQEEWKKNSIPEVQEWSEAAVGFRNAVGPEKVQVAAASMTASHTEEKEELAAAPFFENSYNRGSSTTSALLHGTASAQAYSTLASQAGPSSTFDSQQSSPSILRELSQLPQQFADLTMEQVLALKRRCEIEMDAIRKRDEQVLAARRMALSRADASRWQGWQEFQATPWY